MLIVMNKAIVTDDLVRRVLTEIETGSRFRRESISCEIQEDFNHLLVSIAIDDLPTTEGDTQLRRVGQILNAIVPGRHGAYSWMVVFTRQGKVVDSYFGGDLENPTSGL